ncbi:MAG: hypothetical protein P1P89_17540 [Desulfobacterales bacterium]|nr:hypothetical protein [Desulfobacterales bacterium]
MDFERYYLDLFEMLNAQCKKIASGKYSQSDTDNLFELSKKNRYPGLFAELSESFGMMMVKVEAREFELAQAIEALKESNGKLEGYSQSLEQEVSERMLELKEKMFSWKRRSGNADRKRKSDWNLKNFRRQQRPSAVSAMN